jgi:hypothetical protein
MFPDLQAAMLAILQGISELFSIWSLATALSCHRSQVELMSSRCGPTRHEALIVKPLAELIEVALLALECGRGGSRFPL